MRGAHARHHSLYLGIAAGCLPTAHRCVWFRLGLTATVVDHCRMITAPSPAPATSQISSTSIVDQVAHSVWSAISSSPITLVAAVLVVGAAALRTVRALS